MIIIANYYGLVLEGGGAKGAYHIGVAKALKELNIKINGISGTSIGAINGAMLLQEDLDKAYDIWYNMTPSTVYEVDDKRVKELKGNNINKKTLFYFYEKAKDIFEKKGIDNSKIKNLLEEYINEDKIRKISKDFALVTVSVTDKEPLELYIEDIPDGKLSKYLMASAYLPFFVKEKMDGKIFLDGAFYNNLPVDLLIKEGYKNIIAVRTFGLGRSPNLDEFDSEIEIIEIEPSSDLGLTVDFSKENTRKNLKMGYFDTMKVFKKLKGSSYYFNFSKAEKYYFDFLYNLNDNDLIDTAELIGVKNMPPKRVLFEKIIPHITEMLSIEDNRDYSEIIAHMMEVIAKNLNIDKYHIYNLDEIIEEIKEKVKNIDVNSENTLINFFFKNKLLLKALGEESKYKILLTLFNSIIN